MASYSGRRRRRSGSPSRTFLKVSACRAPFSLTRDRCGSRAELALDAVDRMRGALSSIAPRCACRRDSASSGNRRLARFAPISPRLCSKLISTRPNSSDLALRRTSKAGHFRLWLRAMAHPAALPVCKELDGTSRFLRTCRPFRLGNCRRGRECQGRPTAPISASPSRMFGLWTARAGDLSFLDNPRYLPLFATTAASACLVAPKFADQAPAGTACLITPEPYRAFARALSCSIRMPSSPRPRSRWRGPAARGSSECRARAGGNRRAGSRDRTRGTHRARDDHRRRQRHRLSRAYRARLLYRAECLDHPRARRQPGDHSRRRRHRPGWVRLRHGQERPL